MGVQNYIVYSSLFDGHICSVLETTSREMGVFQLRCKMSMNIWH